MYEVYFLCVVFFSACHFCFNNQLLCMKMWELQTRYHPHLTLWKFLRWNSRLQVCNLICRYMFKDTALFVINKLSILYQNCNDKNKNTLMITLEVYTKYYETLRISFEMQNLEQNLFSDKQYLLVISITLICFLLINRAKSNI